MLRLGAIERALEDHTGEFGTTEQRAAEALVAQAHALCGAAASVGLAEVAKLAHELELVVERRLPDSPSSSAAISAAAARLVDAVTAALDAPTDAPTAPPPPASAEGAKRVILHIEDNVSNLKLVESVLRRRPDTTLVEAQTGAEGLALASVASPDLVLLDLRLPDISGEDVLARLRADEATSSTPVVVVSAEARHSERDRLLAAGADDFLVKPLDIRGLLEVVDRLTAERRR